jgi:hypothetical protein
MKGKRCAVLVTTLVLGWPASALAQGAADNQYQDPFGSGQGNSHSSHHGSGASRSAAGSSSGGYSSPGTRPSSLSGTPPASSSASATDQSAGSADRLLPRTGGEPGIVALLGVGLLLAGVGLRLRWPVA